MAFKIKQERTAPELENARAKLDGALQYLIEKTDESPSTSEDECNKILSEVIIKREPSPVSSAKKPVQRAQRKRRRKEEVTNRNTNSYVMKLFDRAVDLAPFNEQTPLYPICRAWINNQSSIHITIPPKQEPLMEDITDDQDKIAEELNSENYYQLPQPREAPITGKDIRIPSPVPQPEEEFVVCSDEQNGLSKETLMAKHLVRWKAVRRKWKQAAKANEDRYKESGAILKAMFERVQCREDASGLDLWEPMTPLS